MPGLQRGLEDDVFIRGDRTLHHVFAKAIGGADEDRVAKAGLGIDREHDAGTGQVGTHHTLHADPQRHLEVIEALVHAIADGPVGEERGEAAFARLQQRRDALYVEIRLLLAGEARIGQVFGGGRGSHRDIELNLTGPLQLSIRSGNQFLQVTG